MTVAEAVTEKAEAVVGKVEETLGVGKGPRTCPSRFSMHNVQAFVSNHYSYTDQIVDILDSVSREQMSEARLPLAYRDSCAGLLIPLNRCRFEEYYLPWKCVVCDLHSTLRKEVGLIRRSAGRETFVREMPV